MDAHMLGLLSGPLDLVHGLLALAIGIAGGFFIAEVKVAHLARALMRVAGRRPTDDR
jgi:uncharacterized protein YneF (UPF0154 family)